MITTNTNLNFNGNCQEAMNFYAELLGGKVLAMMTAKGSPMEAHMPADFQDKIIHARISVGDNVIMGSDAPAARFKQPQGFSVNITTDTAAEADRIFDALAQGGLVDMPIQETFWAHRFGMCTDRFGDRLDGQLREANGRLI